MKRFFVCTALILTACEDNENNEIPRLVTESEHYNYYRSEMDTDVFDTVWMEKHYAWATDILEVESPEKLNYYKYVDREHLERITGKETNGFAEIDNYNFHSIWFAEGHECIHSLVVNLIGHPPALFNEGIAVALAPQPIYGHGVFQPVPTWSGVELDVIAADLKQADEIPPLDDILNSFGFFTYDTNKTYPMAGSFVSYLIQNYGIDTLKEFFVSVEFLTADNETKEAFENAYGISVDEAWEAWKTNL